MASSGGTAASSVTTGCTKESEASPLVSAANVASTTTPPDQEMVPTMLILFNDDEALLVHTAAVESECGGVEKLKDACAGRIRWPHDYATEDYWDAFVDAGRRVTLAEQPRANEHIHAIHRTSYIVPHSTWREKAKKQSTATA